MSKSLCECARRAELEAALREILDAAERLTRPGSSGQEHLNGARMTNALQAGAALIDHSGILPEARAMTSPAPRDLARASVTARVCDLGVYLAEEVLSTAMDSTPPHLIVWASDLLRAWRGEDGWE